MVFDILPYFPTTKVRRAKDNAPSLPRIFEDEQFRMNPFAVIAFDTQIPRKPLFQSR